MNEPISSKMNRNEILIVGMLVATAYFPLVLIERNVLANLGFQLTRLGLFVSGEQLWGVVFLMKISLALVVTLIGLWILKSESSSKWIGFAHGLLVGIIASIMVSLIAVTY